MEANRDDFTKIGGKLLGTGSVKEVLPRSGYVKENALNQFSTKLDDHVHGAEAVRLTPNALKNLARSDLDNKAKEASNNMNHNTFRRGRVDYD